jgi:hypothetical protein
MNQGTQGYSLTKKTEGRKSRDTVPLNKWLTGISLTHVTQLKKGTTASHGYPYKIGR